MKEVVMVNIYDTTEELIEELFEERFEDYSVIEVEDVDVEELARMIKEYNANCVF